MKKKYEKPQIYIEKFELAQHIAGCTLKLNSTTVEACQASGEIFGDVSDAWFLEESTHCKASAEGYCYTNGTINIATINS